MRVIARAYADQPLDRLAVDRAANLIYIASESAVRAASATEKTGVGFPLQSVFKFNETLFELLCGAWEAGDSARLEQLWSRAEPL
jgi:hypothetical protein